MKKICTSVEQSNKLLSLGLDPRTADMMYQKYETVIGDDYRYDYRLQPYYNENNEGVPCWSLTALLKLIPDTIEDDFSKCVFQMSKYDKLYQISYVREGNHYCAICSYCVAVDATFEMVCWLKENNKL